MVGSKARKVLKLEEGQSPDTIIAAFQGATKKTSLEYNYASATEVSEDLMPGAFLESDEERKTGKYLFFIPSGYGGCAVHVYEDGKHTTSEAAKSFTFNSKRLEKYIKKADNLTKSKQTNKEGVVASPDVSGVEADAKRTSSKKSLSGILSGLLGKKKKKEGKSRPTSAYSVTSTESAPGPDEPDALAAEPTIYVQPKPKEEKPEVKLGMINLRQEISEALGEMLKPGVQLLDEKVIAQFNKQFKTNFAEDQFKVSTVEGFLAGEGVEDEIRRVSAARLETKIVNRAHDLWDLVNEPPEQVSYRDDLEKTQVELLLAQKEKYGDIDTLIKYEAEKEVLAEQRAHALHLKFLSNVVVARGGLDGETKIEKDKQDKLFLKAGISVEKIDLNEYLGNQKASAQVIAALLKKTSSEVEVELYNPLEEHQERLEFEAQVQDRWSALCAQISHIRKGTEEDKTKLYAEVATEYELGVINLSEFFTSDGLNNNSIQIEVADKIRENIVQDRIVERQTADRYDDSMAEVSEKMLATIPEGKQAKYKGKMDEMIRDFPSEGGQGPILSIDNLQELLVSRKIKENDDKIKVLQENIEASEERIQTEPNDPYAHLEELAQIRGGILKDLQEQEQLLQSNANLYEYSLNDPDQALEYRASAETVGREINGLKGGGEKEKAELNYNELDIPVIEFGFEEKTPSKAEEVERRFKAFESRIRYYDSAKVLPLLKEEFGLMGVGDKILKSFTTSVVHEHLTLKETEAIIKKGIEAQYNKEQAAEKLAVEKKVQASEKAKANWKLLATSFPQAKEAAEAEIIMEVSALWKEHFEAGQKEEKAFDATYEIFEETLKDKKTPYTPNREHFQEVFDTAMTKKAGKLWKKTFAEYQREGKGFDATFDAFKASLKKDKIQYEPGERDFQERFDIRKAERDQNIKADMAGIKSYVMKELVVGMDGFNASKTPELTPELVSGFMQSEDFQVQVGDEGALIRLQSNLNSLGHHQDVKSLGNTIDELDSKYGLSETEREELTAEFKADFAESDTLCSAIRRRQNDLVMKDIRINGGGKRGDVISGKVMEEMEVVIPEAMNLNGEILRKNLPGEVINKLLAKEGKLASYQRMDQLKEQLTAIERQERELLKDPEANQTALRALESYAEKVSSTYKKSLEIFFGGKEGLEEALAEVATDKGVTLPSKGKAPLKDLAGDNLPAMPDLVAPASVDEASAGKTSSRTSMPRSIFGGDKKSPLREVSSPIDFTKVEGENPRKKIAENDTKLKGLDEVLSESEAMLKESSNSPYDISELKQVIIETLEEKEKCLKENIVLLLKGSKEISPEVSGLVKDYQSRAVEVYKRILLEEDNQINASNHKKHDAYKAQSMEAKIAIGSIDRDWARWDDAANSKGEQQQIIITALSQQEHLFRESASELKKADPDIYKDLIKQYESKADATHKEVEKQMESYMGTNVERKLMLAEDKRGDKKLEEGLTLALNRKSRIVKGRNKDHVPKAVSIVLHDNEIQKCLSSLCKRGASGEAKAEAFAKEHHLEHLFDRAKGYSSGNLAIEAVKSSVQGVIVTDAAPDKASSSPANMEKEVAAAALKVGVVPDPQEKKSETRKEVMKDLKAFRAKQRKDVESNTHRLPKPQQASINVSNGVSNSGSG